MASGGHGRPGRRAHDDGPGEWGPTRRLPLPPHETEETVRTRRLPSHGDDPHRTEPIPRGGHPPVPVSAPPVSAPPASGAPVSGAPVSGGPSMRGRASVPSQRALSTAHAEYDTLTDTRPSAAKVPWFGPDSRLGGSRRGLELSIAGGLFAFVGWGVWALDNKAGSFAAHLVLFLFVLLVATGVFCLARLAGYYVYSRVFRKRRGSARLSHLLTAVFLVLAGIGYFKEVRFVAEGIDWLKSLV